MDDQPQHFAPLAIKACELKTSLVFTAATTIHSTVSNNLNSHIEILHVTINTNHLQGSGVYREQTNQIWRKTGSPAGCGTALNAGPGQCALRFGKTAVF
jgi:hypothetical protein